LQSDEKTEEVAPEETATEEVAERPKVTRKPDKPQFEKKIQVHQDAIDTLQAQMKIVQEKADEHRGKKGVAKGPGGEARTKMRELRTVKDGIMERRKNLFNQRDAFKEAMEKLKAQVRISQIYS
jgi:hypothetical protein